MSVSHSLSVPENQRGLCPITALKITKISWHKAKLVLRAGWTPSGLSLDSNYVSGQKTKMQSWTGVCPVWELQGLNSVLCGSGGSVCVFGSRLSASTVEVQS